MIMSGRPEFTIVAGPNGAGKSRLGPFYSKVKAFDGDKLAMTLRKDHPDWKDSWIDGSVITELVKQKDAAIQAHVDFAFETNFTSQLPLNLMKEFKEAGYKLCFIYFGLSSIDDAVARVNQRYTTGGHNITNEMVRQNYTEGIKQTQEHLSEFENVLFIDGSTDFGDIIAIHIGKSGKHTITDQPCQWFDNYFKEAFEKLNA